MRLTIDASVVGATMNESRFTQVASDLLLTGHEFIAPALIEAELLSIATKLVRFAGMDEKDAQAAWTQARRLPIERVPGSRHAPQALDLSVRLGHSSYECLYLAVAITERAPLVTADRRLYRTAVDAGLGEHVRWIEDPIE